MSERDLPLPPELGNLSTFIDSHIECLAGSSSELRSIALYAAKHVFDWAVRTEKFSKPHLETLLATLTEAVPPQTRSQAHTQSHSLNPPTIKPQKKIDVRETPIPSLFIEDMNVDQVWQQLDLRTARICENLQILLGDDDDEGESINLDGGSSEADDENEDEDEDEGDAEEMEIDDDESIWDELSDGEDSCSSTADGIVSLQDETSQENEDRGSQSSMLDTVRGQKRSTVMSYSQGQLNLNDGFFDLAAFNAEAIAVEAKEDEDSEESEMDLFGSVEELEVEDTGNGPGPIELFYDDFFDPPHSVQNRSSKVRFHERVSVKRIKAVGKGMPVSSIDDEDEDSDEEENDDFGDKY